MSQIVDLATGNITGGDNNINRNDVNQAMLAIKQTFENMLNGVQPFDKILLETAETDVIDGAGAVTVSMGQAYISAASGTADNLDSINLTTGTFAFLRATPGHTITVRDNGISAGNCYIFSGGQLILSGEKSILVFKMGSTVSVIGDGDTNSGAVTYVSEQAIAGEALTDRNAAYVNESDGKIYHIDADATPPKIGRIRGFVVGSVAAGVTATLATFGELNGYSGLTKHDRIYVDTTPGAITQTRPVPTLGGAQIVIADMGYARAADTIFIDPEPVHYAKRNLMAQNDTMTIEHHSDPEGYERDVRAYISESIAGTAIEEYTSANQDTQIALADRSPATYSQDLCNASDSPNGVASASSIYAGTPSNMFDDSTATSFAFNGITGWLKYDFGSGNARTIRQYTYTCGASTGIAYKTWTFEGSNDNTNWDALDTQTNQTAWGSNEKRTYQFSNFTAYRYYRINVTNNNTSSGNTSGAEFEMQEVATWNDGAQKLDQSFTLSSASDTSAASLYLHKVGSPAGTITIRIETDSAGDPSGTLVDPNATQTLLESSLSTSFADVLENLSAVISGLAAGTYHLVISTDRAASETDYIEWGADSSSPGYAGGEGKSFNGSIWTAENVDFIFGIFAPSTTRPSQIKVDWWSSPYADMVNRYDDGAGANLDTKTTFKCTRSAGFDDLTVEVVL